MGPAGRKARVSVPQGPTGGPLAPKSGTDPGATPAIAGGRVSARRPSTKGRSPRRDAEGRSPASRHGRGVAPKNRLSRRPTSPTKLRAARRPRATPRPPSRARTKSRRATAMAGQASPADPDIRRIDRHRVCRVRGPHGRMVVVVVAVDGELSSPRAGPKTGRRIPGWRPTCSGLPEQQNVAVDADHPGPVADHHHVQSRG